MGREEREGNLVKWQLGEGSGDRQPVDEPEQEAIAVPAASHGGLVVGLFFFTVVAAALSHFLRAQTLLVAAADAIGFAFRAHVLSFPSFLF